MPQKTVMCLGDSPTWGWVPDPRLNGGRDLPADLGVALAAEVQRIFGTHDRFRPAGAAAGAGSPPG
jgi:hypothetical protein